jgi:hypothetical protein
VPVCLAAPRATFRSSALSRRLLPLNFTVETVPEILYWRFEVIDGKVADCVPRQRHDADQRPTQPPEACRDPSAAHAARATCLSSPHFGSPPPAS